MPARWGVHGDGAVNFERQGQRVATRLRGDNRLGTGADSLKERLDLQAKGFAGLNRNLLKRQTGGGVGTYVRMARGRCGGVRVIGFFLARYGHSGADEQRKLLPERGGRRR